MNITLRKHQGMWENVIDEIIDGQPIEEINILATPGAGKSCLPIQATRLIKAGFVDAILWVAPRSALQSQGERGFMDPFFRELIGHDYLIRASTNDINPRRGTSGFITTYQAISIDKLKTVLTEVSSRRYIIFLDEFQFIEVDSLWHEAMEPIVNKCKYVVKMTGTLGRGDKRPIAFMDYKNNHPVLKSSGDTRTIIYSRTDALIEKAILPIRFHLNDGKFKWEDQNGKVKGVNSFGQARTPVQKSNALFTALNSDFALEMLRECVIHWRMEKKRNPGAKLLIVTADYEAAKLAKEVLVNSIGVYSEIATSHESANALEAINLFKGSQCDCLVTIAMAYVGLDVPQITHICTLTNIRAREWIEQMIARGVRIDKQAGPYEDQMCHVFAPMDSKLKKIVGLVRREQLSAIEQYEKIKEEKEPEEEKELEESERDLFGNKVTPISSHLTNKSQIFLGENGSARDIFNKNVKLPDPVKTVREQEIDIRKKLHKRINKFCFDNRYKQQKINSEIKTEFGKGRDLMTLQELKKLETYIAKNYPINNGPIRGTGKTRVPTKAKKWTGRSEVLNQSCYDPIRYLLKQT